MAALVGRLELVDQHGVEGEEEEADIAGDHYDGWHDETEDKMVVEAEPAVVLCAVAGPGGGQGAHGLVVLLLLPGAADVQVDHVDEEGGDDDQEWEKVA